jgi:hypothetical protein
MVKRANETTSTAATKAGSKRSRSRPTHVDDPKLPLEKRSKKADADEQEPDNPVVEMTEVAQVMGLRHSRNPHPGLPAKPRQRRSRNEVAAHRAKQEATAAEARATEAHKKTTLASILAKEDAAIEREKQKTIHRQSQVAEEDEEDVANDGQAARSGSDDEVAPKRETKVSQVSKILSMKLTYHLAREEG